MELTGIHHLTAVSANIRENHRFYTQTLGMRLVKRTVNQDDVSAYHLFYADAGAARAPTSPSSTGRCRASGAARAASRARTCACTGGDALAVVADAPRRAGRAPGEIVERDGRLTLDFEDPEGQRLALVDDGGQGDRRPLGAEPGAGRAPDPRPRARS